MTWSHTCKTHHTEFDYQVFRPTHVENKELVVGEQNIFLIHIKKKIFAK